MNLLDRVVVVARDSPLSRAQVDEVYQEIKVHHPRIVFDPIWIKTTGDLDLTTSLLEKEKTDFFTKEVDEYLLSYKADIAIHSAKDLPENLPEGVSLICYTKGVDSSDVLVFREEDALSTLPLYAKVGTSSFRRIENLRALRSDLVPIDIRGTIGMRLDLLDQKKVDALIIAKAALIRLRLRRKTQELPGPSAPLQGKLAIVARTDNRKMSDIFSCLSE